MVTWNTLHAGYSSDAYLTNLLFLVCQGGKIRGKLVAVLHDTEGVIMEEGSAGVAGKEAAQTGMRRY